MDGTAGLVVFGDDSSFSPSPFLSLAHSLAELVLCHSDIMRGEKNQKQNNNSLLKEAQAEKPDLLARCLALQTWDIPQIEKVRNAFGGEKKKRCFYFMRFTQPDPLAASKHIGSRPVANRVAVKYESFLYVSARL